MYIYLTKTVRILLKAIEKYVRTAAEDINDMLEQGKLHYKDLKDDLKNIRSNEEETRRVKAKVDLLSWISQVNYSSNYDAAQLRTYENDQSGSWFLKSRKFGDWWKAVSRSGLLLTGICEFTLPNIKTTPAKENRSWCR